MYGLAFGPPTIDPGDDQELLLDKLSVEIAAMKNSSEEYLYRRDEGRVVVLRSGSFSGEEAKSRLTSIWTEVYHRYTRSNFNVGLTIQIALAVANDRTLAESTLEEIRKRGGNGAAFLLATTMPQHFWRSILDSHGGMGGVCWLTVARELPYQ